VTSPIGRIRTANAPVSFGIFELTAGEPPPLTADELLDVVSAAGYDGVDLGGSDARTAEDRLDEQQWVAPVRPRAGSRGCCARRGLEPTFHHHACT